MGSDAQAASELNTCQMLGERLHRLEFLLHGSSNATGIPYPGPVAATREDTVSSRLASLESGLHRLASQHDSVQDVLSLRMEQHPSSLHPRVLTGC